jgi:ABC-type multidrug transport system ATPase subunit/ABC-type transporter Mla maintaining outer membrane lipid asymmetry permease subunit MlaE
VLLGVSGGGKSTLLRILAGLEDDPDHSRIHWKGKIQWTPGGIATRRGLVFQQPALLDEWTSQENIQLALDHGHRSPDAKPKSENTAGWWLDHLRIPKQVRISRLSGGQRQRLSLAQALAGGPEVLFYDEPTTGLDRTTAERVAGLLRETQNELGITSIVVTHDYESFLPVADRILVLDPTLKGLIDCSGESSTQLQSRLAKHLEDQQAVARSAVASPSNSKAIDSAKPRQPNQTSWLRRIINHVFRGIEGTGRIVEAGLIGLVSIIPRWPQAYWGWRFMAHYARLVFGGTAILYLATSGGILGFVATYFTLRYMPYKVYSEPLLMEELLGVIGFALYRILVPVLTTLLIAARCAAAVSADIGNKRYGGQMESLQMLHVPPQRYLLPAIVWAFLVGGCLLNQVAYFAARISSLVVHLSIQGSLGADYWQLYFHQRLGHDMRHAGLYWVTSKIMICCLGIACMTYFQGIRPKLASSDVSRTITTTILWATLWVLVVHMVFAFFEFQA